MYGNSPDKTNVLSDYLSEIIYKTKEKENFAYNHFGEPPIICYRGEPQLYDTSLTPSYFRNDFGHVSEQYLIELLDDYSISSEKYDNNLSKMIDSQHYIALSKLLDITYSILPAIYFAINSNEENDGYVYIFVFPQSFSPNSKYLNLYFDKLLTKNLYPYSKDFKVINHSYNNERMKLQSGGFILFPGETYTKIPECYYEKIRINHKDKNSIKEELLKYFNITESTIYPEKDKRSDIIRNKLQNNKSNNVHSEKSYKTEINTFINLLLYEIQYKVYGETNKKNYKEENTRKMDESLRIFRKEKNAYLDYISLNFSKKKRRKRLEYAMNRFELIELQLKNPK
ncbi:FRG domain-containing protein [Mammaliicoccus sciuri]|uniref:FRG domain-containing protein n=1 Tax=Mammaliicoccus sciuri TaxID=1296 RepID=UPI003A944322